MSHEFDNNVTGLVRQKGCYHYEYMSDFENFMEELLSREKFYSSLTDWKISGKEYEHVLNACKKIWNENDERLPRLVLKMWCFIISWCVLKI